MKEFATHASKERLLPENSQNRPSPKPLALVVCDTVSRDPTTGKFSLLGTFDSFAAPLFPTAVRMGVYAVLTGCRGKHVLQLKMIFAGDDSPDEDVVEVELEIESGGPLETIQFSTEFIGPLTKPGVYYVQLCDDISGCLIERRIVAQELPSSH